MFWVLIVLVGCFLLGWIQEQVRLEQNRVARYYSPPVTPPKASQTHAPQPRKIILPDAMTPAELADFGPDWLS
jgi:hypothetical protein